MATTNTLFDLATRVIQHTGQNLFLTGRAGTGKTTFLKHIQKICNKKTVVVAPTGVAAINAGGVTMHSFFQLPFGMFIADAPNYHGDEYSGHQVVNRHLLFQKLRINSNKSSLLRELELLIIDEVSMLRADALDAIDTILRHYRKRYLEPFGGVQVLFIGDLYQLPPVLTQGEAELFYEYYKSPFFFDAKALANDPPLVIALKHIYRQQDEDFIRILNGIRNNSIEDSDLNILHQQYKPWIQPAEGMIVLTSHNARADAINYQKLDYLNGETRTFEAIIGGEFSEKAIPAEKSLQLKIGAQIMFITNEAGEFRRYYNGKLGRIVDFGEEGEIRVKLSPPIGEPEKEGQEFLLERHVWKNIRYKYTAEKDSVEEEELGSFSQYPIRLAWAITIHKSQGLTFDQAIVDAGQSFAAGQVYVALSRIRSLNGLILHSKIPANGISMPEQVIDFYRRDMEEGQLEAAIVKEELAFAREELVRWFDLEKLRSVWEQHHDSYIGKAIPGIKEATGWSWTILEQISQLSQTSENFKRQLHSLLFPNPDFRVVFERVKAATNYFNPILEQEILSPLIEHYNTWKTKPRTKKYLQELVVLEAAARILKKGWEQAIKLTEGLSRGLLAGELLQDTGTLEPSRLDSNVPENNKLSVGETYTITLLLLQQGKNIESISQERGMSLGTIESHVARLITAEQIKVEEVVLPEALLLIREAIAGLKVVHSTKDLKAVLSDDISYGMIRMVLADYDLKASKQDKPSAVHHDLPY